MSIQAVGWALEQELPAGPKLVLVSIANHADHTDGYCWLKAETIAKEASCTRVNVYRVIAALVRNGFLRREKKRGDDGKQRANDYWMLFEREPAKWLWFRKDMRDSEDEGEDDETQDVGGGNFADEPDNQRLPGEQDNQRLSGPSHIGDSIHYTEPSKIKPKKVFSIGEEVAKRGYRAPPQALEVEKPAEPRPVFVIEGSRAWNAWIDYRRKHGLPPVNFTYRGDGEHRGKMGRHFPTLFPKDSTGPPTSPTMTQDDAEFMAQGGLK